MRKIIVILAILSLLVCGCDSIKQAYQSVSDYISPVVDFICSPTAEQQVTADKMLAALDAAQAAGAIFAPELAIVKASAVLNTIKTGGCYFLDQLAAAFQVVDAANAAQAMKALKAGKAVAPLPEYVPLRKMLKK